MRFNLKPLIAAGFLLGAISGTANAESYLFYQAVKGISPSTAPSVDAQPEPTPPTAECRYENSNTNRWIELYSEAQKEKGVGYGVRAYWDKIAVYNTIPSSPKKVMPLIDSFERDGYRYYPGEHRSSSEHDRTKKTEWNYYEICRTPI